MGSERFTLDRASIRITMGVWGVFPIGWVFRRWEMRDSVLRRSVGVGALLLAAGLATAQPVLVTSPLTIGPSDTTILGVPLATAEITVRGTTLTMNGSHTIASLTLVRSPGNQPGVLTHTANTVNGGVNGFALTVTGDVTIQGPGDVLVAAASMFRSAASPVTRAPAPATTP